jgi:hypothetical protein
MDIDQHEASERFVGLYVRREAARQQHRVAEALRDEAFARFGRTPSITPPEGSITDPVAIRQEVAQFVLGAGLDLADILSSERIDAWARENLPAGTHVMVWEDWAADRDLPTWLVDGRVPSMGTSRRFFTRCHA